MCKITNLVLLLLDTFMKTLLQTRLLLGIVLLLFVSIFSLEAQAKPRKPANPSRGTIVWYFNVIQTGIGDGAAWDTAFNDL